MSIAIVLAAPAARRARQGHRHGRRGAHNQLVGYGLVVGLDGTGDQTTQAPFTVQSIINMLAKFGVTIPPNANPQLKNVAAVTVTADLPPFIKAGQTIDVTVASIGNASSLRGGALLMTPLRGARRRGVCDGAGQRGGQRLRRQRQGRLARHRQRAERRPHPQRRHGRARGADDFAGSPVRDAQSQYAGLHHRGAAREGINKMLGAGTAQALDAVSVKVAAPADANQRIGFISQLQELEIEPGEAPARVIINSRTGTVVISSHVRVMPAAVAHGSLSVTITERQDVSQPNALSQRRRPWSRRAARSMCSRESRACSSSRPASTWMRSCAP